jgi:transposase InsO family protein|tara:strand:- start:2102 stop:2401 length:300 start_codon:yes stop_codon:yes gene_type:complete
VRLADISPNEDTGGSVILRVTSADTTLPRSMIRVSQSFFSLLQKNVLNRRAWATRDELRIAIVTWIERTYHRRRRQAALGRLTPVEFETIMNPPLALAA